MKIYLINSQTNVNYDYYDSHIIIANNPQEVVELAQSIAADEGKDAWKEYNVKEISNYDGKNYKESTILLSSFNAG